MTKTNQPNVHIVKFVVRYAEIERKYDFDRLWGFARVGNKFVEFSGEPYGTVTFKHTTHRRAMAEWMIKCTVVFPNGRSTFYSVGKSYERELTLKFHAALRGFVKSRKLLLTIPFTELS